jgi:hypothetical protein
LGEALEIIDKTGTGRDGEGNCPLFNGIARFLVQKRSPCAGNKKGAK